MNATLELQNEVISILEGTLGFLLDKEIQLVRRFVDENYSMTTERLVDLTLDQAKQMAMEALDHEVVRSSIENKLLGRYFSVRGPRVDRYILVESIDDLAPISESQVDELMHMVEAI